jgi:hypothetical protein
LPAVFGDEVGELRIPVFGHALPRGSSSGGRRTEPVASPYSERYRSHNGPP